MAAILDALGRLPKTYRPLIHPFDEFTDRKFKLRYRISKEGAHDIIDEITRRAALQGLANGGGLSIDDKFCLALRYLATGTNFSVVGDFQGVTKATVSRSVNAVVNYFYRNSRDYIKWPITNHHKMELAAGFHQLTGMPRCIGIVDGTHIPIRSPSQNPQAYINRHGYSSLNTMIICDSKQKIIHIDPSWAGSVGDAHAYNLSAIRQHSNQGRLNPYYMLGDSAYPCTPNMFPPVRVPINQAQVNYNTWHRTERSRVERCIGLLKARFRALDGHGGYLYHDPQKSTRIIIAAACLHNVAVAEGEDLEVDQDEDNGDDHVAHGGQIPQPNGEENNPAVRNAFINVHF